MIQTSLEGILLETDDTPSLSRCLVRLFAVPSSSQKAEDCTLECYYKVNAPLGHVRGANTSLASKGLALQQYALVYRLPQLERDGFFVHTGARHIFRNFDVIDTDENQHRMHVWMVVSERPGLFIQSPQLHIHTDTCCRHASAVLYHVSSTRRPKDY